jgi:predicted Zn-dependent peptidase
MEKVGADLDAYTNKEETVVYSVFLQEHLKRAVDLMADLVFHSTFPQTEIEKETDVIIGEIQSYEDTPSDLIFDDFEDLIFSGHSLGRDILGSAEALKRYTTADALQFFQQFYVPENMVFFVTGNYELKQVVRYVEQAVSEVSRGHLDYQRLSPSVYMPRTEVHHRDTHQAHVMIGGRAYDGRNPKKLMLYLLTNLLGGPGMNSRLNLALREKRGLVYEMEANSTSYTDTGTFSIYFGCDLEDVDRCIELVRKELKKLCDAALTTSQLQALKKQTMGQIGVAQDNRENNALGMAKTFLHYQRFVTTEEVYQSMEKVTPAPLLEVANEIFGEANLSTLIYK